MNQSDLLVIEVSVIIPCYNSGNFLLEAIKSIKDNIEITNYEIIIIDDGSTDNETISIVNDLKGKLNIIIINQLNKGPASARNTGINVARGTYLLFLDSDNKIKKTYVTKAINAFSKDNSLGVVYANPIIFGNVIEERVYKSRPFDFAFLFTGNYIDMCSIVKKAAINEVGGFDENMIGLEDWELWIRLAKHNWKFFFLDEDLFEYRINETSLSEVVNNNFFINSTYIYKKHIDLMSKFYNELYYKSIFYDDDKQKPFKSFLKFSYHTYLNKNK